MLITSCKNWDLHIPFWKLAFPSQKRNKTSKPSCNGPYYFPRVYVGTISSTITNKCISLFALHWGQLTWVFCTLVFQPSFMPGYLLGFGLPVCGCRGQQADYCDGFYSCCYRALVMLRNNLHPTYHARSGRSICTPAIRRGTSPSGKPNYTGRHGLANACALRMGLAPTKRLSSAHVWASIDVGQPSDKAGKGVKMSMALRSTKPSQKGPLLNKQIDFKIFLKNWRSDAKVADMKRLS